MSEFPVEAGGILSPLTRLRLAERIKNDIDAFCERTYNDGPRSHLGASEIGDICSKRLWLKFRWAKQEAFSGRMLRLFNRGHKEELRYVEWLQGIGFDVAVVDPDTNKQFRIYAVQGHFGGSSDGRTSVPYLPVKFLCEFKTYNKRRFEELKKNKSVITTKPQHFDQMNMYGSKQGYLYALYFAINKDDDEIHVEVVQLDWNRGADLERKAGAIIYSEVPPPRVSNNPAYWECKYCYLSQICFNNAPVNRNCRSCSAAIPVDNAQWFCRRYNGIIPKDFISKGCNSHSSIPTC